MNYETGKKLILIIDDNVTNLKVAIDYLKMQGQEIITARNGETGLERAAYALPDLILLDIQMPGIDGFETCHRLKASETTKDIPVIFMTALTDVSDKVRAFETGAVDYVTKPIQVEEVWARVQTHLAIRELQVEMSMRIHELDMFARTVAHDLKNPLANIIGCLELLEWSVRPLLDENMQRALQLGVRGSHKMDNIINELLMLASVRRDEVPIAALPMSEIVMDAQERLTHMISDYNAEIVLPDTWPTAVGYAPWVEEVWANYISNGLKYGGRPARVEVGGERMANGRIKFFVKDNGEGLTEEQQAQLFSEFSRLHPEEIQGHGLGLSIVQRIVTRLGGEVGVESEVGQGSTFYFTLPALSA